MESTRDFVHEVEKEMQEVANCPGLTFVSLKTATMGRKNMEISKCRPSSSQDAGLAPPQGHRRQGLQKATPLGAKNTIRPHASPDTWLSFSTYSAQSFVM